MLHLIERGGEAATAEVAWPIVPAKLRATLSLRCTECGYEFSMTCRKGVPNDFDAMVADYLGRHALAGCHEG